MKIRLSRKVRIIVYLLFTWFVLHTVYICYDGLHDYRGSADVAIILGNEVYSDGSLSPWLKGRVDKALALYRAKRVRKIFASGGPGEYGVAEGDAMKKYLESENVADSDIIADNLGKNTY